MRVLMVHGRYALRGGEDSVFEAERDLMQAHGHTVVEYIQDNKSIKGLRVLAAGVRTVWSQTDYHLIRASLRENKIDIVAVHNFFPLISPSVYYAARAEDVPVVQTLHNYRLICPAASLLRDGNLCEQCVGRAVALPAIEHACYRGSRALTTGIVAMTTSHRLIGTWDHLVSRYVALTGFMRDRFIAGGFPPDKIVVKPNFTQDTGIGSGDGDYFVFVGRLSPEKGVSTLLRAWALAKPDKGLRILGTGPEEANLRAQAASLPNVQFLGHQPRSRVAEEMGRALAVVVPSIWYEPFGLTIVEAFAKGTPVLATDLGSMATLVHPGQDGYLFPRGDAPALGRLLGQAASLRGMRQAARAEYEAKFTEARNYTMMEEIYRSVLPPVGAA